VSSTLVEASSKKKKIKRRNAEDGKRDRRPSGPLELSREERRKWQI
jgi:hypothetical protein